MTSDKICQAVPVVPVLIKKSEECPFLTIVSDRGTLLVEVQTQSKLHVLYRKTETSEAIECDRSFPAAVRHDLTPRQPVCLSPRKTDSKLHSTY